MHRFAIGKQDHTQVSPARGGDGCPPADSPVVLGYFPFRVGDDFLNPLNRITERSGRNRMAVT